MPLPRKKRLEKEIKEKVEWESGYGESSNSTSRDMYADHEIEEDIVIGPVKLQRPGLTLRFNGSKDRNESHQLEAETHTQCNICLTRDVKHYTCAHCYQQFFSSLEMIAHLRNHVKLAITCPTCTKSFRFNHQLQEHMITHSNDRRFTCDICSKAFKRSSALTAHKLTHQPKQFQCKQCPKTFTQKMQLQVHERRHTGEKPYVCSFCFKGFTQRTSLNNHILMHKGVKPHSCRFCNKSFRQISNLQQHVLKNHPDDAESNNKKRSSISLTWYTCEKCRAVLTRSEDIVKHKKTCHKKG